MKKILIAALAATAAVGFASCDSSGGASSLAEMGRAQGFKTDALIYAGDATAFGDTEALSAILDQHGKTYRTVSSQELNNMTLEQIVDYGMILWPGGYAGVMSDSLTRDTRDRIQEAVHQYGVSFMGICAGSFIAVSPDTSWGLSVVKAPTLPYYHLENEGTDSAMVNVKFADGTQRNLVWWGGPTMPENIGATVARYGDDHTAAVTETYSGRGFVMLSAAHPEAPADWRTKLSLSDSDGMDWDTAWTLINATLTRTPLPSMN